MPRIRVADPEQYPQPLARTTAERLGGHGRPGRIHHRHARHRHGHDRRRLQRGRACPPVLSNDTLSMVEDHTLPLTCGRLHAPTWRARKVTPCKQSRSRPCRSRGTLSLSGQGSGGTGVSPVSVDQTISAADLGNLPYTPATGYTGTDSFQWNASDGQLYAASAATMTVNVVAPFSRRWWPMGRWRRDRGTAALGRPRRPTSPATSPTPTETACKRSRSPRSRPTGGSACPARRSRRLTT